jgi:hypothetical protein
VGGLRKALVANLRSQMATETNSAPAELARRLCPSLHRLQKRSSKVSLRFNTLKTQNGTASTNCKIGTHLLVPRGHNPSLSSAQNLSKIRKKPHSPFLGGKFQCANADGQPKLLKAHQGRLCTCKSCGEEKVFLHRSSDSGYIRRILTRNQERCPPECPGSAPLPGLPHRTTTRQRRPAKGKVVRIRKLLLSR